LQIKSANAKVTKYELIAGSPAVDNGYFVIENNGSIIQVKGVDRESFSNFTFYARALNKQSESVR